MVDQAVQERLAKLNAPDFGLKSSWSVIAGLLGGLMAICLIFHREVLAAIEVWNVSTAYSHCYLILPMTLYLLWERRVVIAESQVEPDLRFALAGIPLTVLWLLAERLGIMEARQLAMVAGIELLFLTVLGIRFFRSVSGPLLYLFFLVPFGAFLTPALQQFTATFSIVGLDLLGIPNFSDKFTIETPAGIFFVAEACAGLRFFIAAVAFGVFYSMLTYTKFSRRMMFIGASVIVPVIANGFRALGIIVLGQVLGSAEAAAADHLIYGWIFFSFVMLLLIVGGHAFRDADQPISVERGSVVVVSKRSPFWCVVTAVMLLGIGPALAGIIDWTLTVPVLPEAATIVASSGCSLDNRAVESAFNRRLLTVVCGKDRFDVSVTVFAPRSTSSGLISERRRVTQEISAENSAVSAIPLRDGAGYWTVVQTTDPNRVTAYAGWVDGRPVLSSMAGRVGQARDSIFGAAYAPALITITTVEAANSPPRERRATLESLTALLREQVSLDERMALLTRL